MEQTTMTPQNILKEIRGNERYDAFNFLGQPVYFDEFFKDKNYSTVQVHDMTYIPHLKDIIGFCGVFCWENNELVPEDGDSYSKHMEVWGYYEFDLDDSEKGLEILVQEW